MNWADHAIKELLSGKTVQIRPRGNSMKGRVSDGALVTLEPPKDLKINDIVLVKVKSNTYLHLIKAIDGERYQIGNNRGGINGWVRMTAIYGIATKIEG